MTKEFYFMAPRAHLQHYISYKAKVTMDFTGEA